MILLYEYFLWYLCKYLSAIFVRKISLIHIGKLRKFYYSIYLTMCSRHVPQASAKFTANFPTIYIDFFFETLCNTVVPNQWSINHIFLICALWLLRPLVSLITACVLLSRRRHGMTLSVLVIVRAMMRVNKWRSVPPVGPPRVCHLATRPGRKGSRWFPGRWGFRMS